jgi:aspartate racemase
MRKVGLIGGTSWHSSLEYYRIINQQCNDFFGNNTNPPLCLVNLNQEEIHSLQQAGQWDQIAQLILKHAQKLETMGMEALAFCANTPHKVIPLIQDQLRIPFLHIADAIVADIQSHGWSRVGLLGTRFTMAENFLKDRIAIGNAIEVIVPEENMQMELHRWIAEDLSMGIFSSKAQQCFLQAIDNLSAKGAQAVILGCTEIPLLLKGLETSLPTIDTLRCHAEYIADYSFIMKPLERS